MECAHNMGQCAVTKTYINESVTLWVPLNDLKSYCGICCCRIAAGGGRGAWKLRETSCWLGGVCQLSSMADMIAIQVPVRRALSYILRMSYN